jgi:hypothetical protein
MNVHRREPHYVDSEIFDVVNFGYHAGNVSQSITVGIFVAGGIYLVHYPVFPPDALCHSHCCCTSWNPEYKVLKIKQFRGSSSYGKYKKLRRAMG